MRKLVQAAIAACCVGFTSLAAAPAYADVTPDDPDLRCAAVGLMIASSGDQTTQMAGSMIAVHYVGKLQGRDPAIDLEEELFQLSLVITEAEFAVEQRRCGAEFQRLGQNMITMGNNLQRRARELESAN
jgi:hypothetical protein